MIKVIGERDKISFFSLFGFKLLPLTKGERIAEGMQSVIEEDDKLLIVDEEFYEKISQIIKKEKRLFPLIFSLHLSQGGEGGEGGER